LLYGRFFTFYSPKWVFISAIIFFEVGSAVCGAAPTSSGFIVGRAIAGVGSAGIMCGVIVIIVHCLPLHKRPMYTGFMGAVFGISSVIAPLLGGVFTDDISWRWCFYINLPLGAVALFIITLILKPTPPPNPCPETSFSGRLRKLDPLGTICFLPSIVCLLLALEWGGEKYAWSDGRIIALFVLFGVLLIAFIVIQVWRQEEATVPPRLISQRSIACGLWYVLCLGGSMMVYVYYLPIWFQAVKGVSAVKSGIMSLPLVLGLVAASIMSGIFVSKLGYYNPFMYASVIVMSIGAGLFTTFTTETNHS
jgi:MFS family permease